MALLRDMRELRNAAVKEEQEGVHSSTDCEIKANGNTGYAHRAILIARSEFFRKTFAANMLEARNMEVELRHVGSEVSKDALQALLYYLYTDEMPEMQLETAWGFLSLVGLGEDEGGYLGLSACNDCRNACGTKIIESLRREDILCCLRRLYSIGGNAPMNLKQRLIENLLYYMDDFKDQEAFAALARDFPTLMCEALTTATSHMRPGWTPKDPLEILKGWEMSFASQNGSVQQPYPGLANSVEAVTDADMTCGAGTHCNTNIHATFAQAVAVSSVRVAIGHMSQGWSAAYLNGTHLEYQANDHVQWLAAVTLSVPTIDEIYAHKLPQPITASHWRLRRNDGRWLGISYLAFER